MLAALACKVCFIILLVFLHLFFTFYLLSNVFSLLKIATSPRCVCFSFWILANLHKNFGLFSWRRLLKMTTKKSYESNECVQALGIPFICLALKKNKNGSFFRYRSTTKQKFLLKKRDNDWFDDVQTPFIFSFVMSLTNGGAYACAYHNLFPPKTYHILEISSEFLSCWARSTFVILRYQIRVIYIESISNANNSNDDFKTNCFASLLQRKIIMIIDAPK